jgi:hypothetical protein
VYMNRHDDVERYSCYVFMFWIATSCFNSVTWLPCDLVAVDGKRLCIAAYTAAYFFYLFTFFYFSWLCIICSLSINARGFIVIK